MVPCRRASWMATVEACPTIRGHVDPSFWRRKVAVPRWTLTMTRQSLRNVRLSLRRPRSASQGRTSLGCAGRVGAWLCGAKRR